MATKRVYHPAGDSWQDVDSARVSEWTDAGWLTDRPKHVDDSGTVPGVFFVAEPVREPAPEPARAPKAEKPKADKA